MLRELLRPLSYLSIKHPSLALTTVNWIAPVALSAALIVVGSTLPKQVDIYSNAGLMAKVLGFVQNLPGFYLAALAAVATFNKPGMDRPMPGVAPQSKVLYNGKYVSVDLTRRRFLSVMFSFLTAESIAVTLIAIASTTLADPIKAAALHSTFASYLTPTLRLAGVFVFLFAFVQMLTITSWSLYYLGERIHTPDRSSKARIQQDDTSSTL